MTDGIVIDAKDRINIVKNKEGVYEVREITIHDKDTARLFQRATDLLKELKEGKLPTLKTECVLEYEYVCPVCGVKLAAFPEQPNEVRFPCTSAKCNGRTVTWRKVKKG